MIKQDPYYPVIPNDTPQNSGYGNVEIQYVADRPPTASEAAIYNNYAFLMMRWQQAISSDNWQTFSTVAFWFCADNTTDKMIWWKCVFDANILSVLRDQGWNLNTTRDDVSISLTPSTPRQASITNDVQLSMDFNFRTLLSTAAKIELQTSPDNITWTTKRTISLDLTIESNKTFGFSKIIPAGYYYQYLISGNATISVINHFELTM